MIIELSQSRLGSPADIIGIESDAGELLSVPGMRKPFVAYTTRYLEYTYVLRRLITSGEMAPSAPSRSSLSRKIFLEITSERLLRRGHVLPGLMLFLESWSGDRIAFIDILSGFESQNPSIQLFTTLGYGISHELGHQISPQDPNVFPAVEAACEIAMKQMFDGFHPYWGSTDLDDESKRQLLANAREDPSHPLNPAFVTDEVLADLFAFDTLTWGTAQVGESSEAAIERMINVSRAFIAQMMVLHLQKYCERVVQLFDAIAEDREHDNLYFFEDAPLLLRLNLVAKSFPGIIAHSYYAQQEAEGIAESMRAAMQTEIEELKPVYNEVEKEAISLFVLDSIFEDRHMDELLGQAARLAVSQPQFRTSARRFCRLADPQVKCVELAALANMLS